jgi:hypothetical protein
MKERHPLMKLVTSTHVFEEIETINLVKQDVFMGHV